MNHIEWACSILILVVVIGMAGVFAWVPRQRMQRIRLDPNTDVRAHDTRGENNDPA